MEKYCKSCGRVFKDSDFKICPYCGQELSKREGRQPIPRKFRHQVFQRDNYRCRECGVTNKQTRLHVDHIVPVAKGGTNDLSNLQTLCEECNRAKYDDEWLGGQTDLEVSQNELSTLKEQLNRSEENLKSLTDEDEIIKCRFNNVKLKESVKELEEKINLLKEEKQMAKEKQEEMKEIEKLYMLLYVELDEESIILISYYLNRNSQLNEEYTNKNEFIWYLANHYSYHEIIRIKEKAKVKKSNVERDKLYRKLHAELDEESIILISDYLNHHSPLNETPTNKDEFIRYLANYYSYYEIIGMKEKEKTRKMEEKQKTRKMEEKERKIKDSEKRSEILRKKKRKIEIENEKSNIEHDKKLKLKYGIKTCPNCKKEIPNNALRCKYCGYKPL